MSFIYKNNDATYIYSLVHNDPIVDQKTICKYMSINAFLDLITNKRIRFSNITTYDDTYEGIPLYEEVLEGFAISRKIRGIEYNRSRLENLIKGRKAYFSSCWNMKTSESFLMWNSYSNLETGILIFTKVRDLLDSIDINNFEKDNGELSRWFYGEIDYRYNKKYVSDHMKVFCKPTFYQEENEFRVIVYENPITDRKECYFNIFTDRLFNKIIIGPKANDSYLEMIKEKVVNNGIDEKLVMKSKLFLNGEKLLKEFLREE